MHIHLGFYGSLSKKPELTCKINIFIQKKNGQKVFKPTKNGYVSEFFLFRMGSYAAHVDK